MGFFQLPFVPELVGGTPLFEAWLRGSGMDDESLAHVRDEVLAEGALSGGLMWYRAVPLPGGGAGAGTVRVPTTFVWSDGDAALSRAGAHHTPEHVDAPYAFVELEGVSHWVPEEAPEQLAEAILARVASGAAV